MTTMPKRGERQGKPHEEGRNDTGGGGARHAGGVRCRGGGVARYVRRRVKTMRAMQRRGETMTTRGNDAKEGQDEEQAGRDEEEEQG